jgi:NAD(P)-dependent dehydrogenase (short-subunit alcohol dehydrogenase family)
MGRLDGKVAIVTGGASGMGLATVERFVEEGARVVIVDLPAGTNEAVSARVGAEQGRLHYANRDEGGAHDGKAIADRLGDAACFVPADVTVQEELSTAFRTAEREFGGLDIVFNNAGVGGSEGSVETCAEAIFDRVIDVDLKAVWWGMKLAIPLMKERGGGSIISTSSDAGLMGFPGLAAYSAAKAGVIGLTRAAAMELAAHRIRVNAICPGGIVTPIIYNNPSMGTQLEPELLRQLLGGAHPIPRAGEGADIANAALWLASDESTFVTGQAIAVDGGLSAEADSRLRAGGLGMLGGST